MHGTHIKIKPTARMANNRFDYRRDDYDYRSKMHQQQLQEPMLDGGEELPSSDYSLNENDYDDD